MRDFTEIHALIVKLAPEIQALVDEEFRKCNDTPPPDSGLDQEGLRNGQEIVLDYVYFNEYGEAYAHLIYMISETGIVITPQTCNELQDLAIKMEISTEFK